MIIQRLVTYQNAYTKVQFYRPYCIHNLGPSVLSFRNDIYFDVEGVLLDYKCPIDHFNFKYSSLEDL